MTTLTIPGPRRCFTRAVALLAVVSLMGCADDLGAPNPAVKQVSVSPRTATVLLGRTVTISADVVTEGGASNVVSWTSSNTSVASVNQDGVVTGLQPGEAAITAQSTFDATKKDVSTVTVQVGEPATIAIQAVNRSGTSLPVDPNAVVGTVDVPLNVSPGDQLLTRLDLLVDGVVVATQQLEGNSFGTFDLLPSVPFSSVLSFNTAMFDAQSGIPAFLNVPHSLVARVTAFGGLTSTASVQLTFSNTNTIIALLSTNGSKAFDGMGRSWESGDLTVTARPVIYSGSGITLASAVISFPGLQNKTAGASGIVTWLRTTAVMDGGAGGFSNNGGTAPLSPSVVSSTLSNGMPGPGGQVANASQIAIRLDNRPPHPGVLSLTNQSTANACCSSGWVGNAYLFADGHQPPPGDGEGIDGSGVSPTGVTYHVGTPQMTNEQIVGTPALSGPASLAASAFANVYTVVARVSDRVGNSANVRLSASASNPITTFGVDKGAPTLNFALASVPDGAVNPPLLVFATSATDEASGFAAQPILHRIFGNFSNTMCFLGGPGCSPVAGGFLITASPVDGFYFTYEATVRDQGGNSSPTITRSALFDQQPPQITAMPLPALAQAPALTQFTVSAADNVDLANAEHRLDFAGASGPLSSLPFAPPTIISSFGPPLVGTASNVVSSSPFVRSLELTTVTNAPTGTLAPAEGTRFRVTDQAGNVAVQTALFPGGSVPAGTGAGLRSVQSFRISAPVVPTGVCAGGNCGPVAPSIPISAEASGEGNFNNPFSAVHFYWVDTFGLTRLFASTSASQVEQIGNVRRWTWTVNFSPQGFPAQIATQIFAIGVDSEGDGLRSRTVATVNIIQGG